MAWYGLTAPFSPSCGQLKKSPQPISFIMKDLAEGSVELTNRYHFRNLEELNFRWELAVDGVGPAGGIVLIFHWPPGRVSL